jgi:hypothetical protein
VVNETESNVRRTIAAFYEKPWKSDDMLLLYFSGHGVIQPNTNRLYLAVRDTDQKLLSGTAIPSSFISEEMDNTSSRQLVLILDCCHSGAFVQAKGTAEITVPTKMAFQGNGSGRVILTASEGTQNAYEGASTSIFTQYLVDGLKSGEADQDKDGIVSLDEWYQYAYDQVVNTKSNQTPRIYSNQKGTIYIAKNPVPQVKKADLPADILEGINNDLPIARVTAILKLKNMLNGTDPGKVMAAEEALKGLAYDDSRTVANLATSIIDEFNAKKPAQPQPFTAPSVSSHTPLHAPVQPQSYTTPSATNYFPPQKPVQPQSINPPTPPTYHPPQQAVNPPPSPQPEKFSSASLINKKMDELNKIIEILSHPDASPIYIREQLSQWRTETAFVIKNMRGVQDALRFGTIGAPKNIRDERERLVNIAQQCRNFLRGLR